MDDNCSLSSATSTTDLSTLQSSQSSQLPSYKLDKTEDQKESVRLSRIEVCIDLPLPKVLFESRKEMTAPASYQFAATKLALYYGLKSFLLLPRFNSPWYMITRSLNRLIERSAAATMQPASYDINLPVKTLPPNDESKATRESRSVKVTVYPPIPPKKTSENGSDRAENGELFYDCIDQIEHLEESGPTESDQTENQHEKHILFFFGGGYLFGHNGQCSTPMRQLAENGFTVWTPDYTLLPHNTPDISKRNLEEALTVYRHVCSQSKNGPASVGIYGDSAGGEIVIRLAKYCATIKEPIQSPIHLASPAYLEELTEEDIESADPSKEYVLPAFQLLGLQQSMRHRPVSAHIAPDNESVKTANADGASVEEKSVEKRSSEEATVGAKIKETFAGTAQVRITIADGELMQGPAKRLHVQLYNDGVYTELTNYIGLIHSGESLADAAPELQQRLTDTIEWLRERVE